jgi:hypothetical protein
LGITNPGRILFNNVADEITQTDSAFTGSADDNFWVTNYLPSNSLAARSQEDMLDWYNTNNGSYGLWIKPTGSGLIKEARQDSLTHYWTPEEVEALEWEYGGTGGAQRDSSGEFILNTNGSVKFDTP